MRKFLSGLLICVLIATSLTAFAASKIKSAYFNDNVKLQVDGKIIDTEILTAFQEGQVNGKNYVSARDLAEALGAKVSWKQETQTIDVISANKTKTEEADTYKVIKVVDGDTFKIMYNNVETSVRLIGVDTPESVHPDPERNTEFGVMASNFSKKMLEGKTVKLVKDVSETDKYGRLLRYVYLEDGTFYNELLVKEGYARVSTYPPDVRFADVLLEAERFARENNKGLWGITGNESIEENNEEYTYVGSKKSDKYHKPNCRWAKEIYPENLVKFKDKADAEAKGYLPCSVCF